MASPPLCRASPPSLPDDVVEEILLRLPPDDPACILRASVVCKAWRSAICHPSFRRRLHDLHRTPPVLGVLHNWDDERIPRFIPSTASSLSLAVPGNSSWRAIDCRHGRALFLSKGQGAWELQLWEPITGAQWRVPVPVGFESLYPTAAVLCLTEGCDHRDCLGGPFRLVFVFYVELDTDDEQYVTSACVYSSETGTWGESTSPISQIANFIDCSSVLVGNSLLYFMSDGESILEYDLARHSLTEFDPPDNNFEEKFRLMLGENGELVVSESIDGSLKLWSRELSGGTAAGWVQSRVIPVQDLLPNGAPVDFLHVLGFAECANVIFVITVAGLFMIELQKQQARKVYDVRRYCNLIPVVGFYTPHSRLKALGGKHHDLPQPRNPTKQETLKLAHELFNKGCKAMQEGNFANASDCFSRALKIRVLHYGKFAPQCASTFYRYGRALQCKALAATNPSGSVNKSAPNQESVKITATASIDDTGSSSASVSNAEHVPPSHRDDSEEGENLNSKDQEDVKMAFNEANSDLHLAWKMLDIARGIVAKSPEKTMEKVNIFYALAEVCVKREDRDTAIGYYLEALAILEHLVKPDHIGVVHLNFRICLAFESASKVGYAIPYCEKAISVCQSLEQNLKNGKEALLADIDVIASAAKGHSGKFTLEDEISFLNRIFTRLQKKLEELEQSISKPSSGINKIMERAAYLTSHEQNISDTVARAASLDPQVAGSNNSVHFQTMPRVAATSSVSRGIKRANDELISAEPSLKRLAADD